MIGHSIQKVLARHRHLLSSLGEVHDVHDGELEHGALWVFHYGARMEYSVHKITGLTGQAQPMQLVSGIVIHALGESERRRILSVG